MPVSVLNSRVKWLCDEKPRSRATCARGCESSRSMTSAAASRRRLMNRPRLNPTVFRNFLAKWLGEQPTSDAKSCKWKCWLGRASIKSTICLVTVAVKTLSSRSQSGFRPPKISASRKINRRAATSAPISPATPWSGVVASRSMHSRSTASSRGRMTRLSPDQHPSSDSMRSLRCRPGIFKRYPPTAHLPTEECGWSVRCRWERRRPDSRRGDIDSPVPAESTGCWRIHSVLWRACESWPGNEELPMAVIVS